MFLDFPLSCSRWRPAIALRMHSVICRYPALQRSRRAVQASKKWDTRAEKPNKGTARSGVPPTLNLLNYKTFCGPPLGTIKSKS